MGRGDEETIGSLLAERIGVDGQEVAMKALSVSQGTISRYVSGAMVPGDDKVDALAEFLGRPRAEVIQLLFSSRRNRLALQRRVEALEEDMADLRRLVETAVADLRSARGRRTK